MSMDSVIPVWLPDTFGTAPFSSNTFCSSASESTVPSSNFTLPLREPQTAWSQCRFSWRWLECALEDSRCLRLSPMNTERPRLLYGIVCRAAVSTLATTFLAPFTLYFVHVGTAIGASNSGRTLPMVHRQGTKICLAVFSTSFSVIDSRTLCLSNTSKGLLHRLRLSTTALVYDVQDLFISMLHFLSSAAFALESCDADMQ